MSKIQGAMDRVPGEIAQIIRKEFETFVANGQAAQKAVDKVVSESRGNGAPEPADKPRSLNPTRFLCRAEVRNFLLAHAEKTRTHKFSRVSEETLVDINERVRAIMVETVRRLPSKGKTI